MQEMLGIGPFRRFLLSFYRMESYERAAREPLGSGLRFLAVSFLVLAAFFTGLYLVFYELARQAHSAYIVEYGPGVEEALRGLRFSGTEPHVRLVGTMAIDLSDEARLVWSNSDQAPAPDLKIGVRFDPGGVSYAADGSAETFHWTPSGDSTFSLAPNKLGALVRHWAVRDMTDATVPDDWKNARLAACPALDLVPLASLRLGIDSVREAALAGADGDSIDVLGSAIPGVKAVGGRLEIEPSFPLRTRTGERDSARYMVWPDIPEGPLRIYAERHLFSHGFFFLKGKVSLHTTSGALVFSSPYPDRPASAAEVIADLEKAPEPWYKQVASANLLASTATLAMGMGAMLLFAFVGGFVATRSSQTRLEVKNLVAISVRAAVPATLVTLLLVLFVFQPPSLWALAAFVGVPAVYGGMAARKVAESEHFNLLAPPPDAREE
jgi:hypothetical protein